jgi:hypothetical protein
MDVVTDVADFLFLPLPFIPLLKLSIAVTQLLQTL